MKKRIISFLLSAIMIFGTFAAAAPRAEAATPMKASESCIALIKEFEGFTEKAFYDYSQYSIGYGSACNPGDYPNGITKAQADKLLRAEVTDLELSLNKFISKNALALSQQQFDALVSFTYNLGTNWMNNTSTFRTAVINGQMGNDFIFAITMWCNAGGVINKGLVQRRLAEANLYLNGIYSKTPPSNYHYVIFDNNLDSAVSTVKIQGFDANLTDKVRSVPSKTGYRFLGWYDQPEGGEWIATVGAGTGDVTLYGHWQDIALDNSAGIPAKYDRYASSGQIVYDAPNGFEKRMCKSGEKLSIVADYMDQNGEKWGRLADGTWVNLNKTKESAAEHAGEAVNLKVVVTANDVNIRKGPGTNYSKAGTAKKGQELMLTRVQQGGMYLWGQFSGGWICLDYTDYETAKSEATNGTETVIARGEIINTDKLNIRSRPSASSTKVGEYSRGDIVEITQRQQVGSTIWGKTNKGWISLYYVRVVDLEDATPPATEPTQPSTPTEPETNTPATPEVTPPAEDKTEVIATGKVVDCASLRIRAGAGTKYSHVGSLIKGTKVEFYEFTTVGSQMWGRMNKGWICMTYVQLDSKDTGSDNTGSGSTVTGETGTVYNCTALNVRAGAGTKYSKVGRLTPGTKVQILETTTVGNQKWGRISQGWVCMDYIKLSGTTSGSTGSTTPTPAPTPDTDKEETPVQPEQPEQTNKVNKTGVIIGTTQLRVRETPGTQGKQVGTLNKGDRVVILETTNVGSATWGRTEKGWIHMYYVRLSSTEVPEGSVVRTVTENLNIRAGAGTSYESIGKYTKGTQVIITAQTTVGSTVWGRTDKGWISMDYVK